MSFRPAYPVAIKSQKISDGRHARWWFLPALLATTVVSTVAVACNIPVFRYALERWTPDVCEILIFTSSPLDGRNEAFVRNLEQQSITASGPANSRVVRAELSSLTPDMEDVWKSLQQTPNLKTPFVVIRSRHGKERIVNHWSGPLQEITTVPILESPVRKQLAQRLQQGDSVVWLVLKPEQVNANDSAATEACLKLLKEQCAALPAQLELPEGIGLEGSELYSEVPLLLQFSLLELDRTDPKEQYLVRQLAGFQKQAFDVGEPLVVPVFGRGRALEVIPASQLDADLIHDLTQFLCSACSCQVKEQNPGFDLLISTSWNSILFGEDAKLPPPPPAQGAGRSEKPILLPIPPGRQSPKK